MKRRYGLSDDQLDYLLNASQCDLCGDFAMGQKLVVDHCHAKGNNRGLLCSLCNMGLGAFRDNPEILRHAIKYLENDGSGFFKKD